jgi:hypothetical protein
VEFNKDVEDFTQTRVLADEALMNPDIPFTLQVGRGSSDPLPQRDGALARLTRTGDPRRCDAGVGQGERAVQRRSDPAQAAERYR